MASQESTKRLKTKPWFSCSWHRKSWGSQREWESPEKSSLLVLFSPDTCRDADIAISGAAGTVCSHPASHPAPRTACCAHTLHLQGQRQQPRLPRVGHGRSGKQCLCWCPKSAFLGSRVVCPGSQPALNFRMLLVDGVIFHCLQSGIALRTRTMHQPFSVNTVTEMAPLLQHCHSGIPLFRENILLGKNE